MLQAGEISVDFFAGGGGASQGIERAIGRPVDVAINHDPDAIKMHEANHPHTQHIQESVWKADCASFLRGKKVGLAWFSPDCKHFSRAKGTKPVNKFIRSLAWIVTWFVKKCKQLTRNRRGPRIIILENVREFEDWGPLVPCWTCRACQWKGTEGQARLARTKRACPRCDSRRIMQTEQELPDPDRKGLTFRRFVGLLRGLGYHVEWKVLNAADYGAPTHRRRLFLVARNDGRPIVWPDATHGDPKKIGLDLFSGDLQPWRTAAECIDWSIPCPSIFERKKPLAEKTLKRIALGIKRYVLDNPKPFIVPMERENPARSVDDPLGTITTQGNKFNVVSPVVVPVTHAGERRANSPEEPLPTITGANRGELAAVMPHLTKFRTGAVGSGIDEPVPTVTANSYVKRPGGAAPLGLVEATAVPFVAGVGGRTGQGNTPFTAADAPLGTITAKNDRVVVAPVIAHLAHGDGQTGRFANGTRASSIEAPLGTVHAGGGNFALASAFIAKHFGGVVGHEPDRPLGTVTAVDHHSVVESKLAPFTVQRYGEFPNQKPRCGTVEAPLNTVTATNNSGNLVAANLVHFNHGGKQSSGCDEPTRTVTAGGGHASLVYSFLVKYFGQGVGVLVDAPCPTVTTKDRFGLVFVYVEGEPYVIVDIGMRMLRPKELARAQGFHPKTVMTGTATSQVARIGNSVPPDLAFAVARAQVCDVESAVAA